MTVSPNETGPAIFLDRDGTLMRDVDYCGDPAQVEVFQFVARPLQLRLEKSVLITLQ